MNPASLYRLSIEALVINLPSLMPAIRDLPHYIGGAAVGSDLLDIAEKKRCRDAYQLDLRDIFGAKEKESLDGDQIMDVFTYRILHNPRELVMSPSNYLPSLDQLDLWLAEHGSGLKRLVLNNFKSYHSQYPNQTPVVSLIATRCSSELETLVLTRYDSRRSHLFELREAFSGAAFTRSLTVLDLSYSNIVNYCAFTQCLDSFSNLKELNLEFVIGTVQGRDDFTVFPVPLTHERPRPLEVLNVNEFTFIRYLKKSGLKKADRAYPTCQWACVRSLTCECSFCYREMREWSCDTAALTRFFELYPRLRSLNIMGLQLDEKCLLLIQSYLDRNHSRLEWLGYSCLDNCLNEKCNNNCIHLVHKDIVIVRNSIAYNAPYLIWYLNETKRVLCCRIPYIMTMEPQTGWEDILRGYMTYVINMMTYQKGQPKYYAEICLFEQCTQVIEFMLQYHKPEPRVMEAWIRKVIEHDDICEHYLGNLLNIIYAYKNQVPVGLFCHALRLRLASDKFVHSAPYHLELKLKQFTAWDAWEPPFG